LGIRVLEDVRNLPAGVGPHAIGGYVHVKHVVEPGASFSTRFRRKVLETPTTTIACQVRFVAVADAVKQHAILVRNEAPADNYGEVQYDTPFFGSIEAKDMKHALLKPKALSAIPAVTSTPARIEVAPRHFSLEAARQKSGVSAPSRLSFLDSAEAWVLEDGASTHYASATEHFAVPGSQVPLVEAIQFRGETTILLDNPSATRDESTAPFLDAAQVIGVSVQEGKGVRLRLPAACLLPFLKLAKDHGVIVNQDTWRKPH
jgi:hypothetical protein